MGHAFRKLFDNFFVNSEMRVVMLGLDAAGKTTILYKLHIGEVLSTVPTIDICCGLSGSRRIGRAKAEFQAIIRDPFMLNAVILVFANKQDMSSSGQRGAMTPMEVCEGLGLYDLRNRKWHIQGDGLYEGLDWLSSTLKEHKASGFSSVGHSSF